MKILIITILLQSTLCEYDRRVITTLKDSHYRVKLAVVNGEPAIRGQVPYLVSIKEPSRWVSPGRIVWSNLCGGSIIGSLKVLTAAHCFEGNNFYYVKHTNVLRLVAGNLNNYIIHTGKTVSSDQAQWRKIEKLVMHDDFGFPSNDIALVFVNKEWIFSDTVNFIPPATKNIDYPRTCFSAGFGRTNHVSQNNISPVMLIARIDVMSRFKCNVLWGMTMNSFICTDSVVSDVAMGDSGGPLFCSETSDPVERMGRDVLVGIVSGKNFDKTTLFTRVSAFRRWIETGSCKTVKYSKVLLLITWFALIYLLFYYVAAKL